MIDVALLSTVLLVYSELTTVHTVLLVYSELTTVHTVLGACNLVVCGVTGIKGISAHSVICVA